MSPTVKGLTVKNGHYAWYVAILLSAAHLVSFIDRFVMSLVLVPVQEQLGLSDSQLGLLHGTGFVILYSVAALPLGRLADLSNRRNLIAIGILFWSFATAACGLANSFGSLFAARVAVGLGEASLVPAAMSLIAAYFSRDKLARAVGTFTMGASLGKSVALIGGGAILAWLVARGGLNLPITGELAPWQALFVIAAIPGFIVSFMMLTVREPARQPLAAGQSKPDFKTVFRYLGGQRRAYIWHTLASAAAVLLIQSLAAWSPTFYVRLFDFTPSQAGMLVGLVVLVAGPLGHMAGGVLTDKLHARGVTGAPGMVIAMMLLSSILPGLLFCTTREPVVSVIAFGLLNFCITAAAPPGLSGIQMMTPERLRGLMSACFLAAVTFVAVGFGPALIGLMSDLAEGAGGIAVALLAALLLFACLGAAAGWISRTPARAAMSAALAAEA